MKGKLVQPHLMNGQLTGDAKVKAQAGSCMQACARPWDEGCARWRERGGRGAQVPYLRPPQVLCCPLHFASLQHNMPLVSNTWHSNGHRVLQV